MKARVSLRLEVPRNISTTRGERYFSFADSLIKRYPAGETTVPKTARDLTRDTTFGWHTWTWARMQSRLGTGKAYNYYFDQHPEYPADSPQAGHGSPHGSEVAYVFGHLNELRDGTHDRGPSDLRCDGDLLDEFREVRRSEREGNAEVAGVQRSEPAVDVLCRHAACRAAVPNEPRD